MASNLEEETSDIHLNSCFETILQQFNGEQCFQCAYCVCFVLCIGDMRFFLSKGALYTQITRERERASEAYITGIVIATYNAHFQHTHTRTDLHTLVFTLLSCTLAQAHIHIFGYCQNQPHIPLTTPFSILIIKIKKKQF